MSFGSDIGYFKQVMHHPCKPGGVDVIVESAVQAAVVALITFHSFDCQDIIVERIKFQAGIPPGKRGHRKVKPFQTNRTSRAAHNAGVSLFKNVIMPARAIGSGFFIIGIGLHAIRNFTSLLYAASGCDGPGHEYRDMPFGVPFFYLPGFPGKMLLNSNVGTGCVECGFNSIYVAPGCNCTITYECHWEVGDPEHFPNATVQTRLVTADGPASAWNRTDNRGDGAPQTSLGGLSKVAGQPFVGQNAWVEQEAFDGPMKLVSGSLSASCAGEPVHLLPIPGCLSHPIGNFWRDWAAQNGFTVPEGDVFGGA